VINNFEINKEHIISYFIKESITEILKSNYVPKVIDTISMDLKMLVLEKIYEIYEINKKLNTIIE
jgi:hypothetical protein